MRHAKRVALLAAALAMSGMAWAQTATTTTTTTSPPVLSAGQTRVAERFAAPYAVFAGSRENAVALATALRTGTAATLTLSAGGTAGQAATTTTITIEPPTRPMGWGNVKHALALAQFSLAQAGVTNPTGTQIEAALLGGTITVDGRSIELAGVLAQRASGMGWGTIARSYGSTMGAVNRGVRTGTAVAGTSTTETPVAVPSGRTADTIGTGATRGGITSAAGSVGASHGKGVTTAVGSSAGHGAKGLTTASNASSGSGIVTAEGGASHGQGHAYGRGVVTASGSSAAAATAGAGARSSSGVVSAGGASNSGATTANAGNGQGAGSGKGHGKPGG